MERYYVGLDVSKDETAICVRDHDGRAVLATKKATDPDAIAGALSASGLPIVTVVMETGRMTNWLYHELARRGVPIVCVDARQAHGGRRVVVEAVDDAEAAVFRRHFLGEILNHVDVDIEMPRGVASGEHHRWGGHQAAFATWI